MKESTFKPLGLVHVGCTEHESFDVHMQSCLQSGRGAESHIINDIPPQSFPILLLYYIQVYSNLCPPQGGKSWSETELLIHIHILIPISFPCTCMYRNNAYLYHCNIAPVITIPPGTWHDILPMGFCSSPESGWNDDSYNFLAYISWSLVVPGGTTPPTLQWLTSYLFKWCRWVESFVFMNYM